MVCVAGTCKDGCDGVICPGGQECKMGNCSPLPMPDAGTSTGSGGQGGFVILGTGGQGGSVNPTGAGGHQRHRYRGEQRHGHRRHGADGQDPDLQLRHRRGAGSGRAGVAARGPGDRARPHAPGRSRAGVDAARAT